jgi:hypothetical protein
MRIELNGLRRREEEQLTTYEFESSDAIVAAICSLERRAGWLREIDGPDVRACLAAGSSAASSSCGMRATQPPHQSL